MSTHVTPAPTDEEAAAIAAALQVLVLETSDTSEVPQPASTSWRFSGRWWMPNYHRATRNFHR